MNSKYYKNEKTLKKQPKQLPHVKYKYKSTINENVKDKNEKICIKSF